MSDTITLPREELDRIRGQVDALSAECTHLRDVQARQVVERDEWQRRVRAETRRRLEDEALLYSEVYLGRLLDTLGRRDLHVLVETVAGLSDRPAVSDLMMARRTALRVQRALRDYGESASDLTRQVRAEIRQLRSYIRCAGQGIHRVEGGIPFDATDVGCRCRGCELIVAMDLLPDGGVSGSDEEGSSSGE